MKKIFQALLVILIMTAMLCLLSFDNAYAQEAPNVTVKVSQQTFADGKVTYRYRVINNRVGNNLANAIVALLIGYDYYHGIPELSISPVGWTFESGLTQNSTKTPPNWQVEAITTEESPYLNLEWRNNGTSDILPGQVVSDFSVTVPEADDRYLTGHWTVFFADAGIASSVLETDDTVVENVDTTPPTLSISLTPDTIWPPNHKMVLINANISVTDNSDLTPEVKLVTITCNEPIDANSDISGVDFGTNDRSFYIRSDRKGKQKQGRVYTVTYSATDASGNVGTNSATITIPHDRRK